MKYIVAQIKTVPAVWQPHSPFGNPPPLPLQSPILDFGERPRIEVFRILMS
jgi:hypothetical protein